MKVQICETFECSDQNSPNSCHFWNNRSVFLQILHQSSGSWDITPLYFLAKILYTLRSLSKYKFGEILREQSKVWSFALWWAPFVHIMYSSAKKVPKSYVSWQWRVIQSFKEKLTFSFKDDIRNLVNVHPTTQKFENFISTGSFCPKCKSLRQKKHRGVLSWHWTVQNFNKPWLCGFKTGIRNWVNFH